MPIYEYEVEATITVRKRVFVQAITEKLAELAIDKELEDGKHFEFDDRGITHEDYDGFPELKLVKVHHSISNPNQPEMFTEENK